jgi:hypothetical protein
MIRRNPTRTRWTMLEAAVALAVVVAVTVLLAVLAGALDLPPVATTSLMIGWVVVAVLVVSPRLPRRDS